MLNKKLLLVLSICLCGFVLFAGYNRPYRWWNTLLTPLNVDGMNEQPIIKPFNENGGLPPAEGAVSVEQWEPSPPKTEAMTSADFKNPISFTPDSVAKGKELYDVYCISCHGPGMTVDENLKTEVQKRGMPGANVALIQAYLNGPNFDGHIYSVISNGNAIMKRQSYHLSPEERWHVVNYVRSVATEYKNQQQ